jgi:restriction system protein
MNGLCAPQRRKQALGHVTLVQAKRYASHNKIGIEPVAALRSVVANENAQHGLFVTTSDYLPSARAFAARSSDIITLSSSSDVSAWCRAAGESIVSDKSTLVSREAVTRLIAAMHRHPDARLVHAHTGYNVITTQFALVIKETKYAALLMALPSTVVSDDGYGQRGFEIPALNEESLRRFAKDFVWRASRTVRDGRVIYWDGRHTYSAWNGGACHFDLCD